MPTMRSLGPGARARSLAPARGRRGVSRAIAPVPEVPYRARGAAGVHAALPAMRPTSARLSAPRQNIRRNTLSMRRFSRLYQRSRRSGGGVAMALPSVGPARAPVPSGPTGRCVDGGITVSVTGSGCRVPGVGLGPSSTLLQSRRLQVLAGCWPGTRTLPQAAKVRPGWLGRGAAIRHRVGSRLSNLLTEKLRSLMVV